MLRNYYWVDAPSRPWNVTIPVATHWGEAHKANPSHTHEVWIDKSKFGWIVVPLRIDRSTSALWIKVRESNNQALWHMESKWNEMEYFLVEFGKLIRNFNSIIETKKGKLKSFKIGELVLGYCDVGTDYRFT